MKIVSIIDKRVQQLADNSSKTSVKGLSLLESRKISDMIASIRVIENPLQLRSIPSWKAHELTPRYPGKWALSVTRNYRLTFYVDMKAREVSHLKYEDYH